MLMCPGGMYIPAQPGVVPNGMIGMLPQMQVSMCMPQIVTIQDLLD